MGTRTEAVRVSVALAHIPSERRSLEASTVTETRITDAKTGGQKGQKPDQMSLLPTEALQAVSRVYAFGAEKYDRHNWRLGYQWHLSYDAMQRHLMAFWGGEDLDPESGESHLAHAIFHAMTLMTFVDSHPDGDDRYQDPEPPAPERFQPGMRVRRYRGVNEGATATLVSLRPGHHRLWNVEDIKGRAFSSPWGESYMEPVPYTLYGETHNPVPWSGRPSHLRII